MIKSMTGFGKVSETFQGREYQIEIKSVNHRYLDVSIKLPRQLNYLEEPIKKVVNSKLKRGKLDIILSFENYSQEGRKIKLNKELAKMYIEELKSLADEEGISSNIEVVDIAKFPDILNLKIEQDDDMIKNEAISVLEKAVDQLYEMRQIEGKRIAEDLLKRIEIIDDKVTKISEKSTGLIQEYVVKLEGRVREILQTEEIDKSRIAQEVVIYADKCSIEEEITRLKSHVSQFKDLLQSDGAVGKKLDFLVQEMNRETNTIGSKSACLEITNSVIDIKTELENIREQIQNIE